jgi:hypothetical protein
MASASDKANIPFSIILAPLSGDLSFKVKRNAFKTMSAYELKGSISRPFLNRKIQGRKVSAVPLHLQSKQADCVGFVVVSCSVFVIASDIVHGLSYY